MSQKLSSRLSMEFTPGRGLHMPEVSHVDRGRLPSFADAVPIISNFEPLTVTLTVPSMTAGSTQVVTATQGLQEISAIQVARFDTGTLIAVNVSAQQASGLIVSHPTFQFTTNQGNPLNGTLNSGTTYSNIQLQVKATVYAPSSYPGGSVTITATAMLLGGVQNA